MKSTKTVMLLGALALAPVLSQSASAQVVSGPGEPGFVGIVKSQVAGCPNIGFRIVRHSDGTLGGMADYTDVSGTSAVKGTYDKNGMFNAELTSIMGKGPVGTISGNRGPNGGLHAELKGEGCANNHLYIRGVPSTGNAVG